MSNMADERLSKAYRLIEADELGAARAILESIVADEPNNADAWWLYSHSVSDPADARRALDHVLRINPDYPDAAELSQQLDVVAVEPPLPVIQPIASVPAPAEIPETVPDFPELEPEPDEDVPDLDDELENSTRRSLIRGIIAVAVILLVLIVVGVLLMQNRDAGRATPTQVAAGTTPTQEAGLGAGAQVATEDVGAPESTAASIVPETTETLSITEPTIVSEETEGAVVLAPTLEPTLAAEETEASVALGITEEIAAGQEETQSALIAPATATPEETEVPVTPVAEQDQYAALTGAFNAFILPEDAVGTAETDLGETLIVSVCSTAGQGVRDALADVMNILADQSNAAADMDAIGTRLMNCDSGRPLLVMVVEQSQAAEFAAGTLAEDDFQLAWLPQ